MRLASASCVVATGSVALVFGSIAAIGAAGVDEFVPLEDRVFFNREALAPGLHDPLKIVPVPDVATRSEMTRAAAAKHAIVVAALGRASGIEAGPRLDGGPNALPWAPTPAVPPLLSKPAPISRPPETRLPVFRDPSLRAIERAIDRKGRRSHLLEKRKAQSERNERALSRLPLKHMSTRWIDPLSALEVEAETHPEYIMPFANGRVTSLFNQGRRHPAIDLAGALGSPVFATTTGQTVVFAARRGGYGNAVITRDVFGWTHLYGHLKSITARVGQVLDQGEKLGQLGSTGHSTGPHVHYEVRDGKGRHVNPVALLFSGRRVAIGLAWADVGQFGAPSQVASRAADGERLASAAPLEAVPRRPSTTLKSSRRQRSRARHVHAARYAHRVRRAGLDDGD